MSKRFKRKLVMKCGNIFHSICCVVSCLSFVSVSAIVCVGVYLIIFSITYQLAYDESNRIRHFENMETEMETNLLEISEVCEKIEGAQRQFAEWTVEGDQKLERIISVFHPYIESVIDIMGEEMTYGIWVHISIEEVERLIPNASTDFLEAEKHWAFYYDYGQYIFTNITSSFELIIESQSSYGHNLFTNYTVTEITYPRYSDSPHAYYMTKHKNYEYWLSGEMPYMSFSIATGPYSDLGNISANQIYAGNIWFGKTVASFSDYLGSITPSDSCSWLIETNLDYLLAVSDYDKPEDLFTDTFYSPSEYSYNPIIQKFSEDLLPDLLPGIQSGEITSYTSDGTNFLIRYIHWDRGTTPTCWILVNSKPTWSIYRLSYLTIFIVSIFIVFLLCMGCCWCVFVQRVVIDMNVIRKQMKKIDTMELEKVRFPCLCFSFLEFSFLQRRLLKMAKKLEEYRAFLPEILLDDQSQQALSADSTTLPPSSKGSNDCVKNEQDWASSGGSIGKANTIMLRRVSQNVSRNSSPGDECSLSSHSSSDSECSGNGSSSADGICESVIYNNKEHRANKFSIGINETFLLAVMIDFTHGKSVSKIYDCVISCLSTKRGLFYDFDVGSITVIMTRRIRETFGMMIIGHIQKALEKSNLLSKVRFLMSKDYGVVGNLGNRSMKKFCFSGVVKRNLRKMKEKIPYFFTSLRSVFVCENCCLTLELGYTVRMVHSENYFEVGASKSLKDDEWMYVLEEERKLKNWESYNVGIEAFEEGDFVKAKVEFGLYESASNGGDVISNNWIQLCDDKIEEERKETRLEYLENMFEQVQQDEAIESGEDMEEQREEEQMEILE